MKAPNLVSIVAMLAVVAPAVITAITQQFPPEVFWWSMLVTGVIASVVKAIQVYAAAPARPPAPSGVAMSGAPPVQEKSKVSSFLVG